MTRLDFHRHSTRQAINQRADGGQQGLAGGSEEKSKPLPPVLIRYAEIQYSQRGGRF